VLDLALPPPDINLGEPRRASDSVAAERCNCNQLSAARTARKTWWVVKATGQNRHPASSRPSRLPVATLDADDDPRVGITKRLSSDVFMRDETNKYMWFSAFRKMGKFTALILH